MCNPTAGVLAPSPPPAPLTRPPAAGRLMHMAVMVLAWLLPAIPDAHAIVLAPEIAEPLPADKSRPNIVLILTDDLGYGDLGCFGSKTIRTPHLDRLAAEGVKFTDFYVAQAVCTASRAALMSGCYPNRIGMQGALNHTSRNGIHPDEWLMPEMLKALGYDTLCVGKWHLGTVPQLRATRHGFDHWFGIPYSNDNSTYHPVLASQMPPLPLHEDDEVVEMDPDQSQFTRRFTQRALQFIDQHAAGGPAQDRPFFLYLPHVMPHVPIFASDQFRDKSMNGLFADVVEELDWSIGQLLDRLRETGLAENTLVIFFSDNGPWLSYGEHAGSPGPLREGKLTAFEGGVRVPCIVRWPAEMPAGRVCSQPIMSIDLLPTLIEITGGQVPRLPIDGRSVRALWQAPEGHSPHAVLAFYAGEELHAVRMGKWKLHFPHPYLTTAGEPGRAGKPSNWGKATPRSITDSSIDAIASRHGQRVATIELSLFDLSSDPGESINLADQYPEVVQQISTQANAIRQELGDTLTGVVGQGRRPCGLVP